MSSDAGLAVRSAPEQLQRILASRTFRNTEVLKRLLDYLGRKALAGEGHELKEYIVGVEAFGKGAGYDPKEDSAVRVQAGKLRHKLEEYYRTEGTGDSVLVELPKGCFALRFREMSPEEPVPVAPRAPQVIEVRPAKGSRLPWVITAAAAVAAIVCGYFAFRAAHLPTIPARFAHPAVAELWNPFLASPRPVAVSLGAPLFAKVGGRFVRNTILNEWAALEGAGEARLYEEVFGGKAFGTYTYTGIGEAAGAFELGRLFTSLGREAALVPSNSLSWETIEQSNVIFLGPPKYNRQAEHLPASQEFTLERGRIVNVHPRSGEPPFFGQVYAASDQILAEGHALVARLPGLHESGLLMLLASPSTEGSRAAVDFVTRPEYVSKLLVSLRDKQGRIPRYFECVIRARFRSQTPIQIDQVALRVR